MSEFSFLIERYIEMLQPVVPEIYVSFPSRIFYHWVTPLILRGYKKPLTEKDCWQLPLSEQTVNVVQQVRNNMKGYATFHICFYITLFAINSQTTSISTNGKLSDPNQIEDEHRNLVNVFLIFHFNNLFMSLF